MTHDDLIARTEREAAIFGDCPVGNVLREAADALRELQDELANLKGDLTTVRNVLAQADERAERAEAKIQGWRRNADYYRAERDALQYELAHMRYAAVKDAKTIKELQAECERLF